MTIIRSVEKVILQSVAFRSSRFNRRVDRVIREFSSGLHNSIRDDIHGVSSYVRLLPIFIKTNGIESFVANRRGSIIDEDLYHALR